MNLQEISNENRKKVKYGIEISEDLFVLMQFKGTQASSCEKVRTENLKYFVNCLNKQLSLKTILVKWQIQRCLWSLKMQGVLLLELSYICLFYLTIWRKFYVEFLSRHDHFLQLLLKICKPFLFRESKKNYSYTSCTPWAINLVFYI